VGELLAHGTHLARAQEIKDANCPIAINEFSGSGFGKQGKGDNPTTGCNFHAGL